MPERLRRLGRDDEAKREAESDLFGQKQKKKDGTPRGGAVEVQKSVGQPADGGVNPLEARVGSPPSWYPRTGGRRRSSVTRAAPNINNNTKLKKTKK
jgi:hypothetical protein